MVMNKQLGMVLSVFIGVIIAVAFFQTIAQNIGLSTSTVELANVSLGAQTNGTTDYLLEYKSIASAVIINGTTGIVVQSGNYTLTNNVIDPTTGELAISILPEANTGYYGAGNIWYISGTAERTDRVTGASGTLLTVILIIVAIGIVIFAIKMFADSDIFRRFK